ncbi:ATP-binding cassette domain-containing protein [Gammaproteobacteria bacterium]|nr:ATP-binding cassette domain-containing protein [Gammaproteobacteria bacterium]
MSLIEFDHVRLEAAGRVLIDDFNFLMEEGEHVGVIGPSGAGKTTFLNLFLGMIQPTSGHVRVFGKNIRELNEAGLERMRMQMGMLFQTNALFSEWSVFENIAFAVRYHYDVPEEVLRQLVLIKLDAVGLRGAQHLMPSELSGGMARRVALARAMVLDPKFLIYDEPFTGQDPVTKTALRQLMIRVHERFGVSSVMVSHDLADLSQVVDKIIVINGGKIIAQGPSEEIMNSKDPEVKSFVTGEQVSKQAISQQTLMQDILDDQYV